MGVRFPSVASNTFIGPLPASVAETIVLTTPPLTLPLDFSQVFLFWFANMTAGTGTNTLSFRIRRGTTLTGALLGAPPWSIAIAAGNAGFHSGCYIDTPGAVAGQQYSLTVVQTTATAAGTWADGNLVAFAL